MDDPGMMLLLVVYIAVAILALAGTWKAFAKAGEPGWACIVPIYNIVVMCRMAGKPTWWVLLCFVPLVNIIVIFVILFGIAENFGKGAGFGLGLAFLGIIFWPILGFGSAQFRGVRTA